MRQLALLLSHPSSRLATQGWYFHYIVLCSGSGIESLGQVLATRLRPLPGELGIDVRAAQLLEADTEDVEDPAWLDPGRPRHGFDRE